MYIDRSPSDNVRQCIYTLSHIGQCVSMYIYIVAHRTMWSPVYIQVTTSDNVVTCIYTGHHIGQCVSMYINRSPHRTMCVNVYIHCRTSDNGDLSMYIDQVVRSRQCGHTVYYIVTIVTMWSMYIDHIVTMVTMWSMHMITLSPSDNVVNVY